VAEHDSVIPPGGSGTLTAVLKTAANQNRRFSKSINVVTDAEDARSFSLRFTVDVRAPIVAKPAYRLSLTAITGSASSAGILLHRTDGKPLEIADLTLDHPDLVVRARPVKDQAEATPVPENAGDLWSELASRTKKIEAAPGDVWIDLAVTSSAPPGTTTGTLRFTTNDPDAPTMSWPYTVRVRPLIEARPAEVRLWLSEGGMHDGRSSIVNLSRTKKGEFAITGVEVSHPEVFNATPMSTAAASRQAVRVRVAEGLDRNEMTGRIKGSIRIYTDDAELTVVEIPVVVAPTRALAVRRPLPTVRQKAPHGLTTP
jgi:hypothetical protein